MRLWAYESLIDLGDKFKQASDRYILNDWATPKAQHCVIADS